MHGDQKRQLAAGVAKAIRVITVAPVMAFLLLTVLCLSNQEAFGGPGHYLASLCFLCVLPLLAYPLQPLVPGFRRKGREGQRNLAIAMAVLGYVAGCRYAVWAQAPAQVKFIFLAYLLSGVGVLLLNKVLRLGASGHACGVSGPIVLGAVLLSARWLAALWCLVGLGLLLLVSWASLRMKRHSLRELCLGALIPLVCVGLMMI